MVALLKFIVEGFTIKGFADDGSALAVFGYDDIAGIGMEVVPWRGAIGICILHYGL